MNGQLRTRWHKYQANEKLPFVLRYGVLHWGLTAGVSSQIIAALADILTGQFTWRSLLQYAAMATVVFPITGILFGIWMWKYVKPRNP